MNRDAFILATLVFILVTFIVTGFYSLNGLAQTNQPTLDPAVIEAAKAEFLAKICAGHGGVNCSIINSDASVVCNDGTIDTSLSTIYAISQCQKTIEDLANQESDFMAESGCFPPSEISCINEGAYQNLFKHLASSGSANSELGRNELAQCRQDIANYNKDNKNYRQCLINHGRPQFEPSGKIVLPILKAAFCPLFYGNNSSYDFETDLCLCDNGYFLHNGQCLQADKICQEKYGSQASAKNGDCTTSPNTSTVRPAISPRSSPTKNSLNPPEVILPTPDQILNYQPRASTLPEITTSLSPYDTIEVEPRYTEESKPGFIQNIIISIISGIKKMLRLF